MMTSIKIIITILGFCSSFFLKQNKPVYIWFNKNDKMLTYYSGSDPKTSKIVGEIKYLYKLENGNVIFEKRSDDIGFKQIKLSNAKDYLIKDIEWLSDSTEGGLEYKSLEFFQGKDVFLVVADSISQKANIVPVYLIQETE